MEVVRRKISELIPDPANARKHRKKNIDVIKGSLAQFGQQKPIVVDASNIVRAGNGTLEAAKELGWTEIDCVVTSLEGAKVTAFGIADNRSTDLSEWDGEVLQSHLDAIYAEDKDLFFSSGFDIEDLTPPNVPLIGDPDSLPTSVDSRVQSGDVWRLGDHRIVCGDCSKPEVVDLLMLGKKASLIFTDPPYGVSQAAKNRMLNENGGKGGRPSRNESDIVDDDLSPDDLKERLLPAFENMRTRVMAEDCTVFVTAPQGGGLGMMMMMMMEAGLEVRHVLIWKKNSPTFSMGRLDYDYQHEPILLTWGKKHKRPMQGAHRTSVWEIPKPRASADHPTMKPVELVENALLNNSDQGDIVYDGYAGSGTTIIACEKVNRAARVVEIEPRYCDIAIKRWEELTGKRAERLDSHV